MFWNKEKKELKSAETLELKAEIQTLLKRIEICEDRIDIMKTSIRSLRSQFNASLSEEEEESGKEEEEEKQDDGFNFLRVK